MPQSYFKPLFFFCFLFAFLSLKAQDQPFLGNYNYNWQLVNPATMDKLMMMDNQLPVLVSGSARSQWFGIEGAPQTYYLSAEFQPIGDGVKFRVGGTLLYDKTDVFSAFSFAPNFGVNFSQKSKSFYFGLTPSVSRNQLNINRLTFDDPEGLGAIANASGDWESNVGAGFLFQYRKTFYGGISAPGILQFADRKKVVNPYFNIVTGYVYRFSRNWRVEPSMWTRYIYRFQFLNLGNQFLPFSTDLNFRFIRVGDRGLKERYWFGGGFGMSQNLRVEFGALLSLGGMSKATDVINRGSIQYVRFSLIANHPIGGNQLSRIPSLEVGMAYGFK